MTETIDDSSIPTCDVVGAVKSKIPSESKLASWSVQDIGVGEGFVSHIKKIALHWMPPDSSLPTSVIAKIPTDTKIVMTTDGNVEMDAFSQLSEELKQEIDRLHNCEVSVYEFFAKIVDQSIPIPQIYGMKRWTDSALPSFIVMEDLTTLTGTRRMFLLEFLSEQQMVELFSVFGRVHGFSIVHADSVERVVQQMNIMGRLIKLLDGNKKQRENFLATLKHQEYTEICGTEVCEKAAQLETSLKELLTVETLHRTFNIPDVLLHGDVHPQNMLLELDDQGQASGHIKAIIDWQCAHIGNPCEDLTYALMFCAPAEQRSNDKFIQQLIHTYYDSYKVATLSVGPPSFTYDHLLSAFKQTCSLLYCVYIQMAPVFADQISKMDIPGMEAQKDNVRKAWICEMKRMTEKVLEYRQEKTDSTSV